MDITFILQTKNYALIKETIIKSSALPRIGEVIVLSEQEYFVYEVKYKLNDDNILTPHLWCREWFEGDRYVEMALQGWHLLHEEA